MTINADKVQIALLQEKFQDVEINKEETALELKWSQITDSVSDLASILAENLRMIIEPSIASKLQ